MGKGRRKKALLVLAFSLLLCQSAYEMSLREAYGKTVQTKRTERETTESDITQTAAENRDLTEAFDVILQGATRDFIAGYAVDRSFLMWIAANYGDDAIIALACHVLDGDLEADVWFDVTGASIHVLWLGYCADSGFQTERLENVSYLQTADTAETVVSFTGDFNLAEDWCTTDYMQEQPNGLYDCISQELLEAMNASDVLIMNNEFTYSDRGEALAGKAYTFRAKPEMAELLQIFGADAVSLANNHVYDYGEEALLDTLSVLKEQQIAYVGAGEDIEEASKILYYVANGRKIAVVSATQIERTASYTKEAGEDEPGVLKTLQPERFLEVIREAKAQSDYVLAIVHWGTEGTLYPDTSQRSLAEQLVEAGADAVIGGHPHRLQGVRYVQETPVAYSLGNFWFSDASLYTTLLQVVITEEDGVRLRFLPCVQENLTTRLLTEPEEIEAFYEYLNTISSGIGMDAEGNVYGKETEDYPEERIVYDADEYTGTVSGYRDNAGNVIDIVGNLK